MPSSPADRQPPRPRQQSPSVSIVIPVRDAAGLPPMLRTLPTAHEVIVVTAGPGPDATVLAACPTARLVRQTRTGVGNALACGLAASTGDVVVTLDGDGATDPAELPRYVDALRAGADVAFGSRYRDGGRDLTGGRFRRARNVLLAWLLNVLYGTRRTDPGFGYAALWRDTLDRLALPDPHSPTTVWGDGPEIEALLAVRAAARGLTVTEIPGVAYPRMRRSSHAGRATLRHWLRTLATEFHGRTPRPPRHSATRPDQIGLSTVAPHDLHFSARIEIGGGPRRVMDRPAKGQPTNDQPANDQPAKGQPAKDRLAEGAQAKETRAKPAQANRTQANRTQANRAHEATPPAKDQPTRRLSAKDQFEHLPPVEQLATRRLRPAETQHTTRKLPPMAEQAEPIWGPPRRFPGPAELWLADIRGPLDRPHAAGHPAPPAPDQPATTPVPGPRDGLPHTDRALDGHRSETGEKRRHLSNEQRAEAGEKLRHLSNEDRTEADERTGAEAADEAGPRGAREERPAEPRREVGAKRRHLEGYRQRPDLRVINGEGTGDSRSRGGRLRAVPPRESTTGSLPGPR